VPPEIRPPATPATAAADRPRLPPRGPAPDPVEGRAVSQATSADIEALADVLARAFHHDPVHRWLFPTDAECARGSRRFWTVIVQHALRKGTVLTTNRHAGAALWVPPQAVHEPATGGLLFMARMARILRQRSLRGLRAASAIEAHHFAEPHWYLAVLGTAPEHRGKGVSTTVMEPILRRCDADGLPAYLESSNIANIPLYERRGFRVTGEIVLPGGPTIWPMLRQPVASR
jgi:GNAT superfamily N-acetyltransferase